jgi:hypothetical protein
MLPQVYMAASVNAPVWRNSAAFATNRIGIPAHLQRHTKALLSGVSGTMTILG